jgi:hypothetical protein
MNLTGSLRPVESTVVIPKNSSSRNALGMVSQGPGGGGVSNGVPCACGGDIRLIAFVTAPGLIRRILAHVDESVEPSLVSPARGPPTEWTGLVQAHDDREVMQAWPDELLVIDIHSL